MSNQNTAGPLYGINRYGAGTYPDEPTDRSPGAGNLLTKLPSELFLFALYFV